MRNPDRYKEESAGRRYGGTAALGGLSGLLGAGGGLGQFLHRKGMHLGGVAGVGTALGALGGAAGQGLGDAILGQPKEHSFGSEFGRGALGGAIVGAPMGAMQAGFADHGAALVKFLMKNGMGEKAALAAALGGGAALGAAGGALGQGIDSAAINWEPEEK